MNQQNVKWHQCTVQAVEQQLHTNASCGLSRKEARSRYRKLGANTLFEPKGTKKSHIWISFFTDPALIILLLSCLLAICFSELWKGISALVCFAGGVFYVVRSAYHLKKLESDIAAYRVPTVTVLRDQKCFTTSVSNIVAGDVLLLHAGDVVPCDCRLISSEGLHVLTLQPNRDGKAVYSELPKNADTVYPYGNQVFAPLAENMLYGGSELTAGNAVAIAVEVGVHTFLGAMEQFDIPSEKNVKRGSTELDAIRPYVTLYSLLLFVLFLPLAVLGMLTSSEHLGILHVFLSLGALIGSASQFFLLTYFQLPSAHLKSRGLYGDSKEDRAVFKSGHAISRLSAVSDLIVLGRCGTSDGKLHLARCATGCGEFPEQDENQKLSSLCEAFWFLRLAQNKLPQKGNEEDELAVFRQELTELCEFDKEALLMRLTNASLVSLNGRECFLDVAMKEGKSRLLFSERISLIERCTYCDDGGKQVFFDPDARKKAVSFAKNALADGCLLQIVIRQTGNNLCLIGVAALRERMQENLPFVLDTLKRNNVRVSFFFKNDSELLAYLKTVGLTAGCLSKDLSREIGSSLAESFEKYRVFEGFSNTEITDLIQKLKKNGRSVAVLGLCREELSPMQSATLSVSCDPMLYHKRSLQENLLDLFSTAGNENSDRCAQSMRRHADILIRRAEGSGGGLSAMSSAITACRESVYRTYPILRFLLAAQIPPLIFTLLSVIFGRGLMSGGMLLFGGMNTQTVGVWWLLSLSIPSNRLRKPIGFRKGQAERTLLDKTLWLPSLIGSGSAGLYVCLLSLCGVITRETCVPFLFFSMLLLQLAALLFAARSAGAKPSRWQYFLPVAILLLPPLILTAFSIAFSGFNAVFSLGSWNLVTLFSLPLSPVVCWLVQRRFSKKLDRTAK